MKDIINLLQSSNSFALIAHDNPDDDAIASLVICNELLKQLHKKSYILAQTKINKDYSNFITYCKNCPYTDVVIVLDCSNKERVNLYLEHIGKTIIVIDHHSLFDAFGHINYNKSCESTTIILYQLLKEMNITITRKMATAIYMGIYGDTNGFTTDNVTNNTFNIVAELFKFNADIQYVHNLHAPSLNLLKSYGNILQNIKFDKESRILYLLIDDKQIKKFNISLAEAGKIINLLKTCKDSLLTYVFINSNHRIFIRARSEKYNVADIMSYYGGGGHVKAAGAVCYCDNASDFINNVIKYTKTSMKAL